MFWKLWFSEPICGWGILDGTRESPNENDWNVPCGSIIMHELKGREGKICILMSHNLASLCASHEWFTARLLVQKNLKGNYKSIEIYVVVYPTDWPLIALVLIVHYQ